MSGLVDERPLRGLSVLVVEDEAIVSFLIEDILADLGCTDVRLVGTLDAALAALAAKSPDLAVLDVNLGGVLVYPLAARLKEAQIPFLFATGYGAAGIAPEWQTANILQKPFVPDQLATALRGLAALRA